MEASCYCYSHNKEAPLLDQAASSSMELDAALQELGMLSKITDSRTDYLREKIRKKTRASNSLSSAPLCVVQMNSKFVTNFSLSKNSCADSESEEDTKTAANVRCLTRLKKIRYEKRSSRRVTRQYRPYDFPWRSKLEDSLKNIPAATAAAAAVASDRASPPMVSRQDSGNKSNPSSPVKGQNSPTPSGSSIVRSRSLDDLEISKLDDSKEDCYRCYGRSDIDTVSQRISKLHVS